MDHDRYDPFAIDAAAGEDRVALVPVPPAAAAAAPDDPDAGRHGRTLASLGLVYLRHGDPARAMVLALAGMAMGDLRPQTVLLVADAMMRAGDPHQSLTVLGRFDRPEAQLSAPPDATQIAARHYFEARALLRLGEAGAARAAFDRALAARPAPPAAAAPVHDGDRA